MPNSKSETFDDFDLGRAIDFLGLFPHVKWEIEALLIQPSEALKINLKRAEKQVTISSNEWEQRLFMELFFLEALDNHNLRMWQEKQVDTGQAPFRGKAEFCLYTLPSQL